MTKGKGNTPKIEVDRSSISGRFVKPGYAATHPKTTEHEKYTRPKPKK